MINSTSPEPGLYECDASKPFYTRVLGGRKSEKYTVISIYYTSTGCIAVRLALFSLKHLQLLMFFWKHSVTSVHFSPLVTINFFLTE